MSLRRTLRITLRRARRTCRTAGSVAVSGVRAFTPLSNDDTEDDTDTEEETTGGRD